MGWNYSNYVKEDVSDKVIHGIVDQFPESWFSSLSKGADASRQYWGWSTIVDINIVSHNQPLDWDDLANSERANVVSIGGAGYSSGHGKVVNDFIVEKLKELGYTILKTEFSN